MTDPIDAALTHIQERCLVSWSENEIIALIEGVKIQRRQELTGVLDLKALDAGRLHVGEKERWG